MVKNLHDGDQAGTHPMTESIDSIRRVAYSRASSWTVNRWGMTLSLLVGAAVALIKLWP